MKRSGYRVNDEMRLEAVALEALSPEMGAEDDPIWVDIESATPEELGELLAPLDLHPLILEGCVHAEERMRVEMVEGALLLSYPGDVEDSHFFYTRIVCTRRYLITVREHPLPELDSRVLRSAIRFRTREVAAILFYLLDVDQDDNVRAALRLRDDIAALSERIEDEPDSVDGADIQKLKKRKTAFTVALEDQLACLGMIRQLSRRVLALESLREYYDNLFRSLESMVRMMERLDLQLQDARAQYQTALQAKTNRRLNVLTIVQAVFVPLSLVAGIYGMNFTNMPELSWPNAYFVALGAMAFAAVLELWIFYRNGWFD